MIGRLTAGAAMTDNLREALGIFAYYAEQGVTLSAKAHLEILCAGHAASARGWRFIATGLGDEGEILVELEKAASDLMRHEKRRRGPDLAIVRTAAEDEADEIVIRRYYEREDASLNLRHFVEAAFDAGELNRKHTIDVHVTRLQRRIDRD
jgi:hypothetical protein